jgi:catechol 2,3-dioxygenase-like lactoylglutathione lyase family enzyme
MSLNYVTVGTNDPAKARPFYATLMAALGGTLVGDYPDAFGYELPGGGKVWIMRPFNKQPATVGNGVTVGLALDSTAKVDAAYAAALKAGGSSEGAPGPRPLYGPDFYGAYIRDPDGNKLALVHFRNATGNA